MEAQYLKNNHVLRNNARRCLRRTTMVRITSDVNWTPGRANKVLGAGVQTSYVHSSITSLSSPISASAIRPLSNIVVPTYSNLSSLSSDTPCITYAVCKRTRPPGGIVKPLKFHSLVCNRVLQVLSTSRLYTSHF